MKTRFKGAVIFFLAFSLDCFFILQRGLSVDAAEGRPNRAG